MVTELIHGTEEEIFAFGFYMQSNNIGDLTITRVSAGDRACS